MTKGDLTKGDLTKGDLTKGDLTKGDLTKGDLTKGDLTKGDLGSGDIGRGDQGGGDSFRDGDPNTPDGEPDFEMVSDMNKTPPIGFEACVSGGLPGEACSPQTAPLHDVQLKWEFPNVVGLNSYSIYRVDGPELLEDQTWVLVDTVDHELGVAEDLDHGPEERRRHVPAPASGRRATVHCTSQSAITLTATATLATWRRSPPSTIRRPPPTATTPPTRTRSLPLLHRACWRTSIRTIRK